MKGENLGQQRAGFNCIMLNVQLPPKEQLYNDCRC